MDQGASTFTFLFTGAFIFIVLYIIFYSWRDVYYFFCMQVLGESRWFVSKEREQFILSELEKIAYYRNLSKKGKEYFYHRVLVFMLNKHFFGDGIKMSDEIKIFITASAVQITFRIRGFYIEHIQLIRVFPQSVWSQMAHHKVKGLTTGAGVMWLSWPDIQRGFDVPDDGINLGIHEMSHAFMLSAHAGGGNGPLCRRFNDWLKISHDAYRDLQKGNDSFFRKYGATNPDEFFAVSVECFFERPEEFVRLYPAIYSSLCRLFNQDPLNKEKDYKLGLS